MCLSACLCVSASLGLCLSPYVSVFLYISLLVCMAYKYLSDCPSVCLFPHMSVFSSLYPLASLSSFHSSSCVATVRCSLYPLRSRGSGRRHEGTPLPRTPTHTHTPQSLDGANEGRPLAVGDRVRDRSLVDVSAEWPECSKCPGREIGRKKSQC